MNTADELADDILRFVCNRVNLTTGTREDSRRFIIDRLSPYAPRSQSKLEFEDVCANKHGGNAQSVAAQEQHGHRRVSQRARVWAFIYSRGEEGATCEEIEIALSMHRSTCSARVSELKNDGLVKESGRTRNTRTGTPAAVLVAVTAIL